MTEEKAPYKANKRSKTIFRVIHNPDNPYVMMDKRPLENKAITWGSKGILAYLLSRPDNWKLQLGDLVAHSPDGAYAIRKMIKELRKVGHVKLIKVIDEVGRVVEWIYEVHESANPNPDVEIQHLATSPHRDYPQVGNPQVGNRALNNIDNTNIDDDEAKKLSTLSRLYEANIGPITPMIADLLRNASLDFPLPWFGPAVKIAVANNARKWSYIEAILDSWKINGFGWKPAYKGKNGNGKKKTLEPTELSPDELEAMRQYAEAQFSR